MICEFYEHVYKSNMLNYKKIMLCRGVYIYMRKYDFYLLNLLTCVLVNNFGVKTIPMHFKMN